MGTKRIPFDLTTWLSGKSQKVVTRDGKSVRIICTSRKADKPIVALVTTIYTNGDTDECIECYYGNGHYWSVGNKDDDLDLFLVTEDEPELTEFERAVFDCIDETVVNYIDDYTPETRVDLIQEQFEKWSDKLLSIARKQIVADGSLDIKPQVKEDFIAGAEWQAEKDARDMYMSDNRHYEKVYQLGKKDMKKQMMQDAVVANIRSSFGLTEMSVLDEFIHFPFNKNGDKVRIIIVKED